MKLSGILTVRGRTFSHYISLTWLQPIPVLIKIISTWIINHIECTPSVPLQLPFLPPPTSLLCFPIIISSVFSAPFSWSSTFLYKPTSDFFFWATFGKIQLTFTALFIFAKYYSKSKSWSPIQPHQVGSISSSSILKSEEAETQQVTHVGYVVIHKKDPLS